MNFYEHVFIVRPEISSQRAQALADEFGAVLTEKGGEVSKTEYWGLKELAYPIKKNVKGHYILMNLTGVTAGIEEMERQMKLHDDILRYLTLRVEELDPNPSIQMRHKEKDEASERADERERERPPRAPQPPPSPQEEVATEASEENNA